MEKIIKYSSNIVYFFHIALDVVGDPGAPLKNALPPMGEGWNFRPVSARKFITTLILWHPQLVISSGMKNLISGA